MEPFTSENVIPGLGRSLLGNSKRTELFTTNGVESQPLTTQHSGISQAYSDFSDQARKINQPAETHDKSPDSSFPGISFEPREAMPMQGSNIPGLEQTSSTGNNSSFIDRKRKREPNQKDEGMRPHPSRWRQFSPSNSSLTSSNARSGPSVRRHHVHGDKFRTQQLPRITDLQYPLAPEQRPTLGPMHPQTQKEIRPKHVIFSDSSSEIATASRLIEALREPCANNLQQSADYVETSAREASHSGQPKPLIQGPIFSPNGHILEAPLTHKHSVAKSYEGHPEQSNSKSPSKGSFHQATVLSHLRTEPVNESALQNETQDQLELEKEMASRAVETTRKAKKAKDRAGQAQAEVEKKWQEAEKSLISKSEQNQKLQNQVQELNQRIAELEAKCLEQTNTKPKAQIRKVKQEADKAERAMKKEQERLQKRLEDSSNKYAILEAELDSLKSGDLQHEQLQQQAQEIEALKAQLARPDTGGTVGQKKLAKQRRELQQIQEQLENEQQEKRILKKKHTAAKDNITKLQVLLEQAKKDRKCLEKKYTKELERRGKLKERLAKSRKLNKRSNQASAGHNDDSTANSFNGGFMKKVQ